MKVVKRMNEKAWAYLDKGPRESWTKAYFSENCKDYESYNAKILKLKNKQF